MRAIPRPATYPPSYLDRLILWNPGELEDESGEADSPDAFDTAWAAFVTLSPPRQREFLHGGVAYTVRPHEGRGSAAAPTDPLAPEPHALDCQV